MHEPSGNTGNTDPFWPLKEQQSFILLEPPIKFPTFPLALRQRSEMWLARFSFVKPIDVSKRRLEATHRENQEVTQLADSIAEGESNNST